MDDQKMKMELLLREFEESGVDIQTFIKNKLNAAGCTDATAIAGEIREISHKIDENYADLKAVKVAGGTREGWLKQKLNAVFAKITPHQAGIVVAELGKNFSGSTEPVPDDVVFNEINAGSKVADLNEAIDNSVKTQWCNTGESK